MCGGGRGRDKLLAWAMCSILFYIPLPTESQMYRLNDSTFISITFSNSKVILVHFVLVEANNAVGIRH